MRCGGKLRTIALVGSAMIGMVAAQAGSAAELIVNGNFEADLITSETVTGWTITAGPTDSVGLSRGLGLAACCGGTGSPSSLLNQYISFGGGNSGVDDSSISQTFSTTASNYVVFFDVGAFGGEQIITGTAFDTVTNAVLGSLTVTRAGGMNFDSMFNTYSFAFDSAGNNVRLSFTAAGSSTNGRDALLDNVSVIGEAVAAVPEPGTWAMMIGGFGLVGAGMRRRQIQVSYA